MHRATSVIDDTGIALGYYERAAHEYVDATASLDMSALYDRFLPNIPRGGLILDAGSGSGRDTLAFLKLGYDVEAFDASPALCKISSELTGRKTRLLRFQDLDDENRFDGIWACASLLHVPEFELPDAVGRLIRALKPAGSLYMSFKLGRGERPAPDGRTFTDLDPAALRTIFELLRTAELTEIWMSEGEGSHKGRAAWLNALARKLPE